VVGDTPTRRSGPASRRSPEEIAEHRRALRVAAVVAVTGYAAFTVVDLYLHYMVYPRSDVVRILALRTAGALCLAMDVLWVRNDRRSLRSAHTGMVICFSLSAALTAGMATQFGGLTSPYSHGLAFYYGGWAALVPSPWRRTVAVLVPIHLSYFAVLTGLITADPELAAQWSSRVDVSTFSVHLILESAMLAFATVSGHLLWSSRRQLAEARKLGRYRLTTPLGRGAMGEVWLAHDDALDRDVALKILRATPAVRDVIWLRFEREAHAASALTSPHTIKIFDYGASDDGVAYIAMEYLRGMDLHAMVRRHGPLDVRRVVHFARQACRSLGEAHRGRLVHRDVKPANLFALSGADQEDFVKVLDFGLVREPDSVADGAPDSAMIGTPQFMAPEQFLGGECTPAADIYAMGATLYFLLTGSLPFDADGDAELWRRHASAPVVPPSQRRGSPVPAALEAIVARCLAKHPVDRYPDGAALGEALDDLPEVPAWTDAEARDWWADLRLGPTLTPLQTPVVPPAAS